jgi:hypothetical protein
VRLTAEAVFEIQDPEALEAAVVAEIDSGARSYVGEGTQEELRAEERESVQGDVAAALHWIADMGNAVPDGIGVVYLGGSSEAAELDRHGHEVCPGPDFGVLFPVCRCGEGSCERCGWQLTPRTAMMLHLVGNDLADSAFDDIVEHGDDPLVDEHEWALFSRYPRITWRQDAVWRRQAARSIDDLVADLEAGSWPTPTCAAEEMALHLMLEDAPTALADDWADTAGQLDRLPDHPDDYEWQMLTEMLLQDIDILSLFDAQLDGFEDPDSEINRQFGVGDYRPAAWFAPFANVPPRDPRRSFRR